MKGPGRFLAAQSRGFAPRLECVLALNLEFRLRMMLSRFRDWLIGVRSGYGMGYASLFWLEWSGSWQARGELELLSCHSRV